VSSYVVAEDVVLTGKSQNQAQKGTLTAKSPPYTYSLVGSANVKAAVVGKSGQTLGF
jgi:pectate lyase